MNVASRMESTGSPDKIHVSESTYKLTKKSFDYEDRRQVTVKGKGTMNTYFLVGKKDRLSSHTGN